MARRLRIQYPGAIYHIINRGNYRRDVFETDGAATAFETTLGEASIRFGWTVHAFAILRNHFHLALTTPIPNLGEGMHWLQTTFAVRFNRFRSERGHLFQGRYQSPLVEDSAALSRVADYIHLNPVRAGIIPAEQVARFRCSSLARFVGGPRPNWLSARAWLNELGLEDSPPGWAHYRTHLITLFGDTGEEEKRLCDDIARGRPIGTHAWITAVARAHRQKALEQDLPREEIRDLKEARWQAALDELLTHHRPKQDDLVTARRCPRWKIEIALSLRTHVGAPYRWIAEKLAMGSPAAVRVAVCRRANK